MCIRDSRKPLLVACDVYRPAAIEQLRVLGEQIEVPVDVYKRQVAALINNSFFIYYLIFCLWAQR